MVDTTQNRPDNAPPAGWHGSRRVWWLSLAVVAAAIAAIWWWAAQRAFASDLLRAQPAMLLQNEALKQRAIALARPVFAEHCASCHGAQREGSRARGIPSMADKDWLYGNQLIDLEHTIYYGIRSGHPKARNVADMPALGRLGQLTAAEAQDSVDFLLSLASQPHDEAGAQRGRVIYYGKGNCYDCHASDAHGVTDYGTPPLNGSSWIYGGDAKTLYQSIYSGRHGLCPAWYGKLTPVQIRALAIFLREGSSTS